MSELRKVLNESIEKVTTGQMPLDTAQAVHKLADRHVRDRYADVAEEKLRGGAEYRKAINEELEKV